MAGAPSFVLLVGPGSGEICRICRRLSHDSIVVVAPDLETAYSWIGDHLGDGAGSASVDLDGLHLDLAGHEANWRGRLFVLTEREFQLLSRLASGARRAWTFEDLYRAVWDAPYFGDPAPIHSAVKRLRRKLQRSGVALTIEAVRGVGFRLVGETTGTEGVGPERGEPEGEEPATAGAGGHSHMH